MGQLQRLDSHVGTLGIEVGTVTVEFDIITHPALDDGYDAYVDEEGHVVVYSDVHPHLFRYWDDTIGGKVVVASEFENGREVVYMYDLKLKLRTDELGRIFVDREEVESVPVCDQMISLNRTDYEVTRNDDGTFTFVDGYTPESDNVTAATGTWTSSESDYKNHGQYVKAMGGGPEAAHSCIGKPIKP